MVSTRSMNWISTSARARISLQSCWGGLLRSVWDCYLVLIIFWVFLLFPYRNCYCRRILHTVRRKIGLLMRGLWNHLWAWSSHMRVEEKAMLVLLSNLCLRSICLLKNSSMITFRSALSTGCSILICSPNMLTIIFFSIIAFSVWCYRASTSSTCKRPWEGCAHCVLAPGNFCKLCFLLKNILLNLYFQGCFWLIICFCLKGVRNKNKLILRLMEALVYPNPSAYRDQLIRFSALNHTSYSEVQLFGRMKFYLFCSCDSLENCIIYYY